MSRLALIKYADACRSRASAATRWRDSGASSLAPAAGGAGSGAAKCQERPPLRARQRHPFLTDIFRTCFAWVACLLSAFPAAAKKTPDLAFQQEFQPILQEYCYRCHGGETTEAGVNLEADRTLSDLLSDRKEWIQVAEVLELEQMPPFGEPRPSDEQIGQLSRWIETNVRRIDFQEVRRPGPGMARRLNRAEYNNTVQDLLHIDYDVASAVGLPKDKTGEHFDTLAGSLQLQPLLMEKYIAATEKALDRVARKTAQRRIPGAALDAESGELPGDGQGNDAKADVSPIDRDDGVLTVRTSGTVRTTIAFDEPGVYEVSAEVWSRPIHPDRRAGRRGQASMLMRTPEQPLRDVKVRRDSADPPQIVAGRLRVGADETKRTIEILLRNPALEDGRYVELSMGSLAIVGPVTGNTSQQIDRQAHDKIFFIQPGDDATQREAAKKILKRFAYRAYRRPVDPNQIEPLMALFDLARERGKAFEPAVRLVMRTVMLSPEFLFRIEQDQAPHGSDEAYPVTDHELASRLSYFLWSTMPDEELFRLASKGELSKPEILRRQVRRMIRSPEGDAFIDNFGGQWLDFRDLADAQPDRRNFPDFKPHIRNAMQEESRRFFEYIVRHNRPVTEILDGPITFWNRDLLKYYLDRRDYFKVRRGVMKEVHKAGGQFKKVDLRQLEQAVQRYPAAIAARRGILGKGSFHVATSHPGRTAPSARGEWVLARLLGTPPPPPPPNAGMFDQEQQREHNPATFREKLKLHASEPACANCHRKMDPIGFALQSFDAVGRWRTERSGVELDTSGKLPDGSRFDGINELRSVLMKRKDQFTRTMLEKMLTYALGREVQYFDEHAIRGVMQRLSEDNHRFEAMITGIVESYPFMHRQNSGAAVGTAAASPE